MNCVKQMGLNNTLISHKYNRINQLIPWIFINKELFIFQILSIHLYFYIQVNVCLAELHFSYELLNK